ncbi:TetR/AcrR family transcriptional regulator [Peribacillus kribbensis]|uniref:TetR/AcrR family transcriptional regulator n=1 Tax=Peribacillus kribbensis TaxID=356658 RepID=UPI000410C2CF|nr:TetR/AcrR family transcriptional regulator [Peribacillus kribbensis]
MNTTTALMIKEIALEHFARKGYEGTCFKQLAKEIGITPSDLRTYFLSKEDIFLSVYDFLAKYYTNFLSDQIRQTQGMKLEERAHFIVSAIVNNIEDDPVPYLLWKRVALFPPFHLRNDLLNKFNGTLQQIYETIAVIFQDAKDNGEIVEQDYVYLASNFYNFVNALTEKIYFSSKVEIEKEVQFMVRTFLCEITR